MKALLIDPYKRELREVTFDGLADLQKLVGGSIEAAYAWANGDTLFVDEEGVLKPNRSWFYIAVRKDQLLAGYGVIVGAERETDEVPAGYVNDPPTMTLPFLAEIVLFTRKVG